MSSYNANIKSDCSGLVGSPVDGPPLCTFTMTNGSSADSANEIVSLLRASPGPLVPVTASFPVNEAPTEAAAAAISSSA